MMLALITGPSGEFEADWIRLALLKDNVQHHLEKGHPSCRFWGIHELADAIHQRSGASISARRLRGELLEAWNALAEKPISDIAMSLETRALVISPENTIAVRGTLLVRFSDWEVPCALDGARTLSGAFFPLLLELERVTRPSNSGDCVYVARSDNLPQGRRS
jgi:hypothetical protein